MSLLYFLVPSIAYLIWRSLYGEEDDLQQKRQRIVNSIKPYRNRNKVDNDSSTASFERNNRYEYHRLRIATEVQVPHIQNPDWGTNHSSALVVQEDDELTKLKNKWDAELKIDNFIQAKISNLPQSYQDLLTNIVKNCHQTIEDHLKPHWSTTTSTAYALIREDYRSRCHFYRDYVKEANDRYRLSILKSDLEIYIKQKVCFDNAVSSCFKQIIDEYENSDHDTDSDPDTNQVILNITDKINLERKRLCMRLPIYVNRHQIQQQVDKNQIVIIKGQTGCGKSTQIPQYLAELNIGKVICTQPNKLAAISLANHLRQEYVQKHSSIDYIVNRSSLYGKSYDNSIITFVTDSVLLDILVDDPTLSSYGCIIVDQAHQRSLYTDILLAFLKQILTSRHDLKLVIITANVDTKVFSDYFNNCPVISIPEKPSPVDVKWCKKHVDNYFGEALDTVVKIHNEGEKGDILVFLATPDETDKACLKINELLNHHNSIVALLLHDDLEMEKLQDIFKIDSSGRRKIIFTTNYAETSIVIPGIRYVVDTGFVQERIYDEKSDSYSLRIHLISKNSAIQRCDHAGWYTKSGVCYRLYSQQVYNNMLKSSQSEIKRVDPLNIFLKMIELGITNIVTFNFIELPSIQKITDSIERLHMLSAITTCIPPLRLTPMGKLFCKLPFEPGTTKWKVQLRLLVLIMNAMKRNMLAEGMIIASAFSCQLNCYYESGENKRKLGMIDTQFHYGDGDVILTAEIYIKWRSLYGKRQFIGWCNKNKSNWKLLKLMDKKLYELEQLLHQLGIINQTRLKIPLQLTLQSRCKLRQLLFQCYPDQIALFTGLDTIGYITTCNDNQYLIHNSSCLSSLGINPKFVIYQEILTTSDHFLINVTPIDEEWLHSMKDCNNYTKLTNLLNNTIITQATDTLGSIIFSEYDTKSIDNMIKYLLQEENIRCNIIKNAESRNLQLTTIKSKMPQLLDVINQSIMQKRQKLLDGIKILPKNDDINGPRLIIGKGIVVKDILLSGDCIEFKITLRYTYKFNPNECVAVNAIEQVLTLINSSGKLAIDKDNISINKSKDHRLIRFDKVVYQQKHSQSLLKANDMKMISGYEMKIEDGSLANCSTSQDRILVQFRWPRMPRNGKVSITCRSRTAAVNVKNNFPLTILNHTIRASIDRHCCKKLFIHQIPNFITAADIRMAIPLGNRHMITKIYFHRKNTTTVDKISASRLESTLRSTLDKMGYHEKYFNVTIKPMSFVKDNPNIIADVLFRSYGDAVSAVQSLNDEVFEELINEPISVRLNYSRIIRCQGEIYTCIEREICRVKENVERNNHDQEASVHITPSYTTHPMTSIVIRSWNESSLNEIVYRISKIIEPIRVPIDVNEILQYLNTNDGKTILASLRHRFNVPAYAKIHWKSQCLLIYGIKKVKNQALRYCQKQIKLIQSKCKIIDLVVNGKPNNLVEIMFKRYGFNLNKLQQLSGANVIQLNRKHMTLMVVGGEESFTKVSYEIDFCRKALDISNKKSIHEIAANECVACLCEADDDNYRLQYCGHLYCQQCITQQINSAIRSSSFPLNCANCNQEFVIEDVERLLVESPQPRLFEILLTEFVRHHQKEWYYCPTPECKSVYKRSDRYEVFNCPKCLQKTCCRCDTNDHPGYSCDEAKLYRKNPDASLEIFLSKNPNSVKKCPRCSAPIEKIYGCHHMTCKFCKTHFCWLCLNWYKTAEDCYRHLRAVHRDYF